MRYRDQLHPKDHARLSVVAGQVTRGDAQDPKEAEDGLRFLLGSDTWAHKKNPGASREGGSAGVPARIEQVPRTADAV